MSNTNIATMLSSIAGVKQDWKVDWKEDAIADWKVTWATNATVVVGNPPVNTVLPVASGTGTVGSTLSVTTGTWTGDATITYTYQWFSYGSAVLGATSPTYVVQMTDSTHSVFCQVTATNAAGHVTASSNSIVIA
jgi:hypothetical protein